MTRRTERGRVGIIADDSGHVDDLREVLGECGYRMVAQLPATGLTALALENPEVEVWLVVAPAADADLRRALAQAQVRVHIETQPPGDLFGEEYVAWQRRIGRAIDSAAPLSDVDPRTPVGADDAEQPLNVWVLASSLGGPPAVKEFLDALATGLPLAMIYAQHIEAAQQDSLTRVLGRHSHYRLVMAEDGQYLKPGTVNVMPVSRRFEVTAGGCLRDTGEPWSGPYRPCLDQVIESVARSYRARAGAVVFSGMGEDGSQGCTVLAASGGQVWAQDAASCGCSSMPDAVRASCQRVYSAAPAALGRALNSRLRGAPGQRLPRIHA